MRYAIIHQLPGRFRIRLFIPDRYSLSNLHLGHIEGMEGVKEVSFNRKTKGLLVGYKGGQAERDALLKAIEGIPLMYTERIIPEVNALKQKKKNVLKSLTLLLSSPFMPPWVRIGLTLYGAMPIFKKGAKSLFERRLNVDSLDASAIGVAMGMGDYRTAGVISLLLKVGDYFEEWTREKSRNVLSEMFCMGDVYAWVVADGREEMVKITEIKEGDVVIVRTGGRIPVDGIVINGEAMVNQSSMTGEALPIMKREGLMVYAGTAVEEGALTVRTINAANETRVAKIIKVIEESEGLKADVQTHAERLADGIVTYTFLLSGLTYAFTGNPVKAASVLLVDYSCAIKLSTPLAIMAGMLRAAREGVLIKGGRFIEKMSKADVFVMDKTGTLTEALPDIVDVIPFNGFSKDYVLRHAACVEEHFPHPVANAVVKKAKDAGLLHEEVHSDVEYVLAHGIASRIGGRRILVGSRHFVFEDEGIKSDSAEPIIKDFADKGYSILYVAIGNELAGVIIIEDLLRSESQRFLQMLKGTGVKRIVMLTGDNNAAAKNIAKRLGIDEYYAGVLPDRKVEIIKGIKDRGHVVVMVGDGINDSAALLHADVGISMRHGADIAKEACDILLLDGDLTRIIYARVVSQKTMSMIKENFRYIVGVNSALIGFGLLGAITPAVSAFMHNTSTIAVALNCLKTLKKKKEDMVWRH